MIDAQRRRLPHPSYDCLYMHGVGMRDPGGGGAFKLWYKPWNGKPRLLYYDVAKQWVQCTVEQEMVASQGSVLGSAGRLVQAGA
eukprot:gene12858-14631_t